MLQTSRCYVSALSLLILAATGSAQLLKVSSYACNINYTCEVTGNGFTIWSGSAFTDCSLSSDEILLSHSLFRTTGDRGQCNNGAVDARSLTFNGNIYTSKLSVMVNSHLIGSTINCTYAAPSNSSESKTIIGSAVIEATDTLPAPTNLRLVEVSPMHLTFNWTSVPSGCLELLSYYRIDSDCGMCLETTDSTSVNCSLNPALISSSTTLCRFAVTSIGFNNSAGSLSEPIEVTLKVPESPNITSIVLSYKNGYLIALNLTFTKVAAFSISEGISGSASYYTIQITDQMPPLSDANCNPNSTSRNIPANSRYCNGSSCNVNIDSELVTQCSLLLSTDTIISVSATNMLGTGVPSSNFSLGHTNKFVEVDFNLGEISCKFTTTEDSRRDVQKFCSIKYGRCGEQLNTIKNGSTDSSSPDTAIIELPFNLCGSYCYTIIASNGTFTVILTDEAVLNVELIIVIGVVVPVVVIIVIAAMTVAGFLIIRKCRRTTSTSYHERSSGISNDVIPLNYSLKLRLDFRNSIFYGNLKIKIKVKESTTKIVLNCAEIGITSAMIEQNGEAATVSYEKEVERVRLEFGTQLSEGEKILNIVYTGNLNEDMRGFYSFKRGENMEAATMFESADARRALPCWDEPEFKAKFDVVLIVPRDMTALSNMDVKSEAEVNGNKCVTFNTTPEMSTYLLAFVVGYFDEPVEKKDANDVLIRVYTPVGKRHLGEYALELAVKMLPFYQNYFGTPYPLPKLDIVAIPVLAPYAMENWGLIIFRESRLLIDLKISPAVNIQNTTLSIGHMLAQQWFGNLVTTQSWDQLWLYEGFTNWMKYYCINKTFPEHEIWANFLPNVYAQALSVDAFANSDPIEMPVQTESEEKFNSITYSKGPSIFRMLYDWIGDENFCRGIRAFMEKYDSKNAGSDELWECLSEASGQLVKDVMLKWTTKAGYPLISITKIKQEGNKRILTVCQKKFKADKPALESVCWQVPLTVTTRNKQEKHLLLVTEKSDAITIEGVGPNDWILLNPSRKGFYRVHYSEDMLFELGYALKNGEFTNPEDRMGLQDDAFALAHRGIGKATTSNFLKLLQHYDKEPSYTVWKSILYNLSILDKLLSHTSSYTHFKQYVVRLITPKAKELGWDQKDNDNIFDRQLRNLLIGTLGRYGDEEITKEAQRRFEQHVFGTLLPTDLRTSVYSTCLADESSHGDDIFNKLEKLHEDACTNNNNNEKVRIYHSLGYGRTNELISRCLEFSLSEKVHPNHTQMIISSATESGHEARNMVWEFLKKNWETLKKRYPGQNNLMQIIDAATSGFVSKNKADEIEKFFERNQWKMANSIIKQNCEAIRLNASWLKREGRAIKNWLATTASTEQSTAV